MLRHGDFTSKFSGVATPDFANYPHPRFDVAEKVPFALILDKTGPVPYGKWQESSKRVEK